MGIRVNLLPRKKQKTLNPLRAWRRRKAKKAAANHPFNQEFLDSPRSDLSEWNAEKAIDFYQFMKGNQSIQSREIRVCKMGFLLTRPPIRKKLLEAIGEKEAERILEERKAIRKYYPEYP